MAGIPIDDLLLGNLPARAAAQWGDRPAVYWEDGVETHAEFAAQVDRVAKGLLAIGVENGDHVGVWMTNRPEWLYLMYAIPKVGGCLVPLNTRYRADDMAYTVINSESRVLITIDRSGPIDYDALLAESRTEIEAAGHLRTVVRLAIDAAPSGEAGSSGQAVPPNGVDSDFSWEAMLDAGESVADDDLATRAAAVRPDQLMMLAYTSGTTGNPKGVMHNHGPIRNVRERTMLLGHHQGDVLVNYLPLFHIYSLSEIAMVAALTGGAQVLFDAFDPDATLDAIERFGVTMVHGFDSHWGDLLAAQAARPRDTSSLRLGSLPAGMRSTVPIAEQVQDVFCQTISGFGMSECWAFICCSHPTNSVEQRIEASGYPMDGVELEVRNPETGEVLPPDTPGQLYVRYYTVTEGYWANPDATAATIDIDGWLDTGDMAAIRPDGHVVFVGRYKDMLKVGGENMSPAEVEGYLLDVAGVAEVAVVAYPDERLAEVPVAYVVRSKDDANLVTEDELIEGLRGRIASYKIPRAVIFLDEMPMTPSGKIRKVELRARALDDLPTDG